MALTVDQLAGYIERGLDADLARWFPDAERAAVPVTRPVGPFLARLPQAAASALAAFDRRVQAGTLPALLDVADWSYAFEFAANDCRILDTDYESELSDDDVWSLGADGGGNYFVVLADGRVALWFHEEEVIEAHTQFDDPDVFLWTLVRYHAVRTGALDLATVESDFRSLAQAGALAPEVGLLARLG
ncbi:hypothetical protein Slala03_71630 [Streptomyces lavendulae subsp. lavendulae]|uniref:hypothetical protein n=1 Tax=Streptomyces lavendulae TaxID=1914 RepID=UPI00249FDD21|nr:hypothetical protein [Streptomyces lavendulae]GLV87474.1 hypothetical protein Slala03_71630 [Streptomyces lavendulae subsp. lavendulae]